MDNFVHLHLHSEYSLLDGACRIRDIAAKAKSLGQTAAALTDSGNLYAAVDFYNAAKIEGIKPIIGCEVYIAQHTRFDRAGGTDSEPYHLVLLCENNEGYRNLIKIVSIGYTEGNCDTPRVDEEILRRYSGGLIALSGCINGEIPRHLLEGDYEKAKKAALLYRDIFGEENFFLEVQNHKFLEEENILVNLYRIAAETGIPVCAANDVHYLSKDDAKTRQALVCIKTNTPLARPSYISLPTNEYYMKSRSEMEELFRARPDALDNTVKIAERCNVEFEFGKIKLPRYGYGDNTGFFRKLCYDGFAERYGEDPPEAYRERLEYELDVVIKMGYTDYYLIVWDFVHYAKTHDIPVGPGRGSGAGSIAAYCIGITNIDPMKYGLLFERFLNPERVSMPDFDIDFCYEKRQLVIDYVVKKYGRERVAQIITFGTMAAKAAIRDIGRVMELPYQKVDTVAKLIPNELHATLENAMKNVPALRDMYRTDSQVHELLDLAKRIEGMPRHASTHAAGVVISDAPVTDYVPVQTNDGITVTQYPMNILESLGLLKMDFLALRNLTIIDKTVKQIRLRIPDFDIENIPLDDKEVFKMFSAGDTDAVFQFESAGMRRMLTQLEPVCIEDLIAALSLYRPGPMDSIPRYIEMRRHPERVTYKHPILKDILDVTNGCIVYQEQVMQICRKLAGYSYGRADLVRRAMAKKKADVMEKERESFIEGAVGNGVPEKTAEEIFNEMSGFASYAFNKSHAAAYALVAYQTAYLKCRFFKEYMAEVMTNDISSQGKLADYIALCENRGIKILPPDINKSEAGFKAEGNGIRFALLAVRNLGRNIIDEIIAERKENGNFRSLDDFCRRMSRGDINRKAVEFLIKSGALDCLGLNRHEMLDGFAAILLVRKDNARSGLDGQVSFFDSDAEEEKTVYRQEEYPLETLLGYEKEALGMYVSGHPLDKYKLLSAAGKLSSIRSFYSEEHPADGSKAMLICTITAVRTVTTKKGSPMAFAAIEDDHSECETVFFPEVYSLNFQAVQKDSTVFISGTLSYKDDAPKILADSILPIEKFLRICAKGELYIRCKSTDERTITEVGALCNANNGAGDLIFYFEDLKRYMRMKSSKGVNITEELLSKLSKIVNTGDIALKFRLGEK